MLGYFLKSFKGNLMLSHVFLLPLKGVWSRDWAVKYQSQCAFKGTSVTIPCSYSRHRVPLVTWYRGKIRPGGWTGYPFINSHSMKGHFQYLGDTSGSCTLRINRLLDSDQAGYFVILKTDDDKFTAPYISLTVQGRLHTACCWYFINDMLFYVAFVK